MAQLEVQIGAQIKDFQSKLAKALKGFDKLKAEEKSLAAAYKKGEISADKYYNSLAKNSTKLNKASATVNNYKNQLAKLQPNFDRITSSIANGSSAMTAFSRTVQDAPFGLMGVSNNITNLTEQFGYLKARTGSAGGALKAMLKDLSGFGGITLAISVATSVLLVWGDKIFATKDRVKELRKEQEDLTKSLDDYVFGLNAVAQANIKGEKSAQRELTTLSLLKGQLDNTTLSLDKRKGAIEQLRKKYPEYLKNMTDEKLLNGGLASVYDTLTTSIIKRAKATASMNAIIKNSEKLLVIESQLEVANEKLAKAQKGLNSNLANTNKLATNNPMAIYAKTGAAAAFNVKGLREEVEALNKQIKEIETDNLKLETNVTSNGGLAESLASSIVPEGESAKAKEKLNMFFEQVKEGYVIGKEGVQELVATDPLDLADMQDWEMNQLDWENYFNLKAFEEKSLIMQERLAAFNERASQLISGSIAQTFGNLGTAIGQALAEGGNVLGAIGSTILQSLAGFLGKLGDLMIEYGTMAVIKGKLDLAIAAGGPFAIAAGIAAIGVGVALKAISGALGSVASGGNTQTSNAGSTGGSSGGSSFSGGSNVNTSSGGTYVFEIQGTKLVGVLSNTLRQNASLGGNLSLGI